MALALLALACGVVWGFGGHSYDDNFITYRYARNLADGEGLVYNPGERVFGTSAPGYAIALAGLTLLGGGLVDVPLWGSLLSVASVLTVAAVLWRSAGPLGGWVALLFAFSALCTPLGLYLLGSESFPVLALVVLSARSLFAGGRDARAGLLVGLAMFVRLDAGLAALSLGLVAWRRGRFPLAYALNALAVLTAWLGCLWLLFGTLTPNTLAGKAALRPVPWTLRQWEFLSLGLAGAGAPLLLAGALAGAVLLWRRGLLFRPGAVSALAGWVVTHDLTYRLLGVWFAPWYQVPQWHALLALFSFAAPVGVARAAAAVGGDREGRRRLAFAAGLSALSLAVLAPSLRSLATRWGEPRDPRFRLYAAAARHARQHVAPSEAILAMEIGVFGYFSERRILDLGALVSPALTRAKASGTRAEAVARERPDWVLAARVDPLMSEVLAHEDMRGRYEVVSRIEDELQLLRRVGPD